MVSSNTSSSHLRVSSCQATNINHANFVNRPLHASAVPTIQTGTGHLRASTVLGSDQQAGCPRKTRARLCFMTMSWEQQCNDGRSVGSDLERECYLKCLELGFPIWLLLVLEPPHFLVSTYSNAQSVSTGDNLPRSRRRGFVRVYLNFHLSERGFSCKR